MPISPYERKDAKQQADPFVYASIFDSFLTGGNPFRGMIVRWVQFYNVLINIGKAHKIAQKQIDQAQQQVSKVEGQIAMINPKFSGSRLDKIR